MRQMLEYLDILVPKGDMDSQSNSGGRESISDIGEKLRSRVVVVTMLPQIMSTIYLIFWRSSDIVSDRPSAGTSLVRGIFYLVLDLVIPILMFTLLSTFAFIDRQAEEVKEANQTRSVFLQTISHELRTPVHGILASTEFLSSSSLNSAQRALVSAIHNSGVNVIHMADHILRVAKSDDLNIMRGITHETKPFDLYKATVEITDGTELLFETEHITFEFDYKIPLHQSMYIGDVGIIKQIIINLLGTVLSLGHPEQVTLTVENQLKEPTEKLFTVEFNIITDYKIPDQSEESEGSNQGASYSEYLSKMTTQIRFIQTLIDALGGSFEFNKSDFKTPFVIKLDLTLADDDFDPNRNIIPIPHRYAIKKFEDMDPRSFLRIGVVRAYDSIVTRKILTFLQEFEMKSFKIVAPEEIPSSDINVVIFDSSETTNEINDTICKISRETRIFIISITFLLKHLKVCEVAQKVGLDDYVYFIAKPLTNVKLWNALLSVADAINKGSRSIESAKSFEQGSQDSHQAETSEI
ncbi:12912_t:CDS:10 [Cetraspora pellucida]|uniref:12912_t:CDS:1 n=1 Tax=Cetraspora pellucida TaxID=1433469 RepID=A0A9N9CPT1_9GLOM|nr:12912_t:CDS:10 [Cetraspora pellucida]